MVYSCDLGGVVLGWSSATKAPLRRFAVGGQITSVVYADGALWLGLTSGIIRVHVDAAAGPDDPPPDGAQRDEWHDPAASAVCLSIREGWAFELKAEASRFVRHTHLSEGAGDGVGWPDRANRKSTWISPYAHICTSTFTHSLHAHSPASGASPSPLFPSPLTPLYPIHAMCAHHFRQGVFINTSEQG